MVGMYGETLVVDWGLAKALGRSGEAVDTVVNPDDPLPEASLQPSTSDHLEATQAGSLVGTPAYMSPEQAAGWLDLLGPASDIYGLGATLYHLIVGRPPISSSTWAIFSPRSSPARSHVLGPITLGSPCRWKLSVSKRWQ